MLTWARDQWRSYLRWRQADKKGWGWCGQMLTARNTQELERALRNGTRIYRLCRGSGNPWRD